MAVAPPPTPILRVQFRTHQKDMAIRLERQANRRELGRKTKMRGGGGEGENSGREEKKDDGRKRAVYFFFYLFIYWCARARVSIIAFTYGINSNTGEIVKTFALCSNVWT